MSARWRFETLDQSEIYFFEINPNEQTSPAPGRDIKWEWSPGEYSGVMAGKAPIRWQFSGVLRSPEQYGEFLYWLDKREKINLIDDLFNIYKIYLTGFEATQEGGARKAPHRMTYTMTALLYQDPLGGIT